MPSETMSSTRFLQMLGSALIVVACLMQRGAAHASDAIQVTRFDDPEPANQCTPTDCSLRAAVLLANHQMGMDEIELQQGTYLINLGGTNDRWSEDAGYTADLDITDDVMIRGAGQGETIITEVAEAERGFDIHEAAHVHLLDFAIRDLGLVFAPSGCGKAIRSSGVLIVERVTLSRNSMRGDGGGICNLGGQLTMSDSIVEWSCGCVAGSGGGIYSDGGNVTLDRVRLANNIADVVDGGGIYTTGDLTITESMVDHNRLTGPSFGPKRGGGIFARNANLTNVTISNNAVERFQQMEPIDHFGGGLFVSGQAQLKNITIFGNSTSLAAGGGGLHVLTGAEARLVNTILANNDGGDCSEFGVVSLGHNIAGDESCALTGTGDMNSTDPRLAPLAGVGHGTGHSPLLGSPAIDAASSGDCPPSDQRGITRPKDGDDDGDAVCDIGSFEAKFASLGDVDCDGQRTTGDGLALLLALTGLPIAAECFSAADLNGDGQVDVGDVTQILRHVAALPE